MVFVDFDSRRRLHCFVDADLIFAGAQSEAIDYSILKKEWNSL